MSVLNWSIHLIQGLWGRCYARLNHFTIESLSTSHQNLINNSVAILSSFPTNVFKFCAKFSEISAKLVNFPAKKKALSNFPPKRKLCIISRQKERLVKVPAKKKDLSNFPPKIKPCQIFPAKNVWDFPHSFRIVGVAGAEEAPPLASPAGGVAPAGGGGARVLLTRCKLLRLHTSGFAF